MTRVGPARGRMIVCMTALRTRATALDLYVAARQGLLVCGDPSAQINELFSATSHANGAAELAVITCQIHRPRRSERYRHTLSPPTQLAACTAKTDVSRAGFQKLPTVSEQLFVVRICTAKGTAPNHLVTQFCRALNINGARCARSAFPLARCVSIQYTIRPQRDECMISECISSSLPSAQLVRLRHSGVPFVLDTKKKVYKN